nr:Nad4 [Porphyridium purpureum]
MYLKMLFKALLLTPFVTSLLLGITTLKSSSLRVTALWVAVFEFFLSLYILLTFNSDIYYFQHVNQLCWFFLTDFNYTIGLDSFSLVFIVLTNFLMVVVFLLSWRSILFFVKEYLISFFLVQGFILNVFSSLDIILFYIFFESILLPMFIILGIWGSKPRKIYASFLFFLYTLFGSLPLLLGIILIVFQSNTTDFQTLWFVTFTEPRQLVLFLLFFMSFSVKTPMFPFHSWLPEAHSEATSAGSVILAGILLKLGGYGFIRFSLAFFPMGSIFFSPLIFCLSLLAVIYGSLITTRQLDLKTIIAYSSIVHMAFVTAGIFSFNYFGLIGSIYLMISHGLFEKALFFEIDFIYERYKTRSLKYYGGLLQTMPLFSIIKNLCNLTNIGLPGTGGFVSELLVLIGVLQFNSFSTTILMFNIVYTAVYSIWILNRVLFKSHVDNYIIYSQDLSRREFILLVICIFINILLGVSPSTLCIFLDLNVLMVLDSFI